MSRLHGAFTPPLGLFRWSAEYWMVRWDGRRPLEGQGKRRLTLVPVFLPKEVADGCRPGSRPSPKRTSQGRSNGGGLQPPANGLGAVDRGPSSSVGFQPDDTFFLLCTAQLPFPITSPFTTVTVALLQSLESQNPSELPQTLAQTPPLDGSPGTEVQPFPCNADFAGPS